MRYLHSRSDAESISTTTSQDSRGSNKENNRPDDEAIILRKKTDYSRVRAKCHNSFSIRYSPRYFNRIVLISLILCRRKKIIAIVGRFRKKNRNFERWKRKPEKGRVNSKLTALLWQLRPVRLFTAMMIRIVDTTISYSGEYSPPLILYSLDALKCEPFNYFAFILQETRTTWTKSSSKARTKTVPRLDDQNTKR